MSMAAVVAGALSLTLQESERPVDATAAPVPILWLDATNPASYPGTGSTWFDLSGNARNGAIAGPITFDATYSAMAFPGGLNSAAHVDLPGNYRDFSGGITIEFEGHFGSVAAPWERVFDFANLIGTVTDAPLYSFWVGRLDNHDELAVEIFSASGTLGYCHTATDTQASLGNQQFQKWLITIANDGPKTCRIYRNGVALPTRAAPDIHSINLASAGADLQGSAYHLPPVIDRGSAFLGRSNFLADDDLEGAIRYIRLFDQALDPNQVQVVSTATVTFDANGGAGSMASQSSTVSATLTPNTFARGSAEFIGWNTSADGTGVAYEDGASYPFSSSTVLYAQWSVLPGSLPEPLIALAVPTTISTPSTSLAPTSTTTSPPTTIPRPVRDEGGAVPQPGVGNAMAMVDGAATDVAVTADGDGAMLVRGDGFEVRLAPECATPCGFVGSDSPLVLEPGGSLRVTSGGFLPGGAVHAWLFSDPTYLGALEVQADGTVAGEVAVPDLAEGEHTLQINGEAVDGAVRSISVGLLVSSGQSSTTEVVALPATGTSSGSTLAVVVALLTLGTLVLVTRRRSGPQHPTQFEG